MGVYTLRRFAITIPTLVGATLLVFFLLRVLPGDVAEMLLRGESGEGTAMPWTVETLRKELGLDRPLAIQYLDWIWDLVRVDFGKSLWTGRSVGGEILHRMPLTVQLAVMAELMAILLGIPIGILTAIHQDTRLDYGLRFWSIFFLGIPTFWLGLMVLLVGVHVFNWMPPPGYYLLWQDPKNNLLQLIWPAAALASHEMARIARMTRSAMLEVLREDYIRTARAKGLSEWVVIARHAMRNALIPIVTFTSVYFATLLGGTVVLERVFAVPGLGTLFLEALTHRDYPMVQALLFLMVAAFMVINLGVDLLYGWLDPRISYS